MKLTHILVLTGMLVAGNISVLATDTPELHKGNNARFEIHQGATVSLTMPEGLTPVAHTALQILAEDMNRVLNANLITSTTNADISCSIDPSLPREGFRINVVHGNLHIVGADSHGLAYGLMELSKLMGVSAWEYWADVTPLTRTSFELSADYSDKQQPAVAYRGIFINDEDWGLNPWATHQEPEALVIQHGRIKGAVGPHVTERIFRLMLRLHLNYYWPAMHECTQPFFLTPGNREVAARYGIYIGGSHCEPMASSAAAEWGIRGKGDYNYVSNREAVKQFWQERLDSVKGQEILYTLGMRGVHDGAMEGVRTDQEKVQYLQMAINDQRQMLAQTTGKPLTEIPQVFVPYKEVLQIYHNGLQVPDDVTLMWTDDNYGYVRYFPNTQEQLRPGGNGLYYHISYWGRPHDYCWLSTLSPHLMEQQLTLSYQHGIRQIWMLNVGDIKPAEVQIDMFARMAWSGVSPDMTRTPYTNKYMREMLGGEVFTGMPQEFTDNVIDCLEESYRLAWDRKPEHMAGTRVEERDKAYWNEVRPIEYWSRSQIQQRLFRYQTISDRVEQLATQLPAHRQDAFFQLVKYPIQAAAQMNLKYLDQEKSQQAYDSIVSLTRIYNNGIANGGKWNGIMSFEPRGLRVFQPAGELPQYADSDKTIPIIASFSQTIYDNVIKGLGTKGEMLQAERGNKYCFEIPGTLTADSVTLTIQLLPNHPVGSSKLTFSIGIDDDSPVTIDYETYDRSEEWKQNVLRNLAVRTVTLPINTKILRHTITFTPMTDGVLLDQILCHTDTLNAKN